MDGEKSQTFEKMFKAFQLRASYFSENYMRAVKKGANIAEKEILKAAEDRDQPVEVMARKLFKAIKLGVLHAAEEMLLFGINLIEQMKGKSNKK